MFWIYILHLFPSSEQKYQSIFFLFFILNLIYRWRSHHIHLHFGRQSCLHANLPALWMSSDHMVSIQKPWSSGALDFGQHAIELWYLNIVFLQGIGDLIWSVLNVLTECTTVEKLTRLCSQIVLYDYSFCWPVVYTSFWLAKPYKHICACVCVCAVLPLCVFQFCNFPPRFAVSTNGLPSMHRRLSNQHCLSLFQN